MSEDTHQKELTRQELYEKVWSTPGTKLIEELGISDVAITKRCRKLNIPRPSRGYWRKIEVGKKPRKVPLPLSEEDSFIQAAGQSVGIELSLPQAGQSLHTLATELIPAIKKARLDRTNRASLDSVRTLPEVVVSKALAERAAQAFHVIIQKIEPLGITFRKAQGSYDSGYFQKSHDRLYLKIEEQLIEKPPSRRKSNYSAFGYGLQQEKMPSGHLTFSLKTNRWRSSDAKEFSESGKVPLGKILARLVKEIRSHYVAAQKRRRAEAIQRAKDNIESEIRWKKYQENLAKREEEEAKKKHEESLKTIAKKRQDALLKAAEWWKLYQSTSHFISKCEQRWKESQHDQLTASQSEWLAWARHVADGLSPFALGYPDPFRDGAFEADAVPFGGPYPETRDFPLVSQQSFNGLREEFNGSVEESGAK